MLLFAGTLALAQARDRVPLDALIDRAGQSAVAFGEQLQGVVAREQYVQTIRRWNGGPPHTPGDGVPLHSRHLSSSLLLVHDPDTPWQLHRDVAAVDGQPVADREDRLRDLFAGPRGDARQQLRAITDESARFNLGHISRNINVPTFPLLIVHPTHRDRFRFRDAGVAGTQDGTRVRLVTWRERGRPRVVRGEHGRDVALQGELAIDEDTGELLRAVVAPRAGGLHSRLEVWFAAVPSLPRRVPVRLWEWYWLDGVLQDQYIEGEATYDQFRRYTTSVADPVPR